MYIAPSGQIKILHDIPLDNTYQHTLYFASESAQSTWFSSRAKYTFNNQTYTRLQKGVIRVGQLADSIYDCNYIMYQNTNFGNKWFYGFIKGIEYINNEVSEIRFEIDVIQTWYFDFDLQPSFVERMHTATDEIGDNIKPESFNLGEYVFTDDVREDPYTYPTAILLAVTDTQATATGATFYGSIFCGSTMYAFNADDYNGLNTLISSYNTRPDAITMMYVVPAYFIRGGDIPDGGVQINQPETVDIYPFVSWTIPNAAITPGATLDGYTPHNNKLYTYPYNFFRVFTGTGNIMSLRYEFFDHLTPELEIDTCVLMPVQLVCRPKNYRNVAGATPQELSVNLDGYPMCSWNVDAYNAWVAQNTIPIMLDTTAAGANTLIGAITSPFGGSDVVADSINQIKDIVKEDYKASIAPDMLKGSSVNGSVAIAAGTQCFYYGRMCISNQYAKTIDGFFDMFGYAIKEIRQPVRKTRTYWTYIKTVGCVIDGSVPSDDANKICRIHDSGTCYWDAVNCDSNQVRIGNYLMGGYNRPLTV